MVSIQAFDLNLLLVLHTVLSERNVARAAARLHVTPPAVSNSLARLRELLGDPLFTRHGRGIAPTPRALELAPVLARALKELEQAVTTAPFDAARCERTFTLAVADVGQLAWAPALTRLLAREMPRARLRIVGIDALISLGDLASPEVDVHVGIAGNAVGLHTEPLLEEPTLLVARRRHPAGRRKCSARTLSALRHVRVEMAPGRGLKDPFAATFERAGAERVVVLTVPSFIVAAEVVAKNGARHDAPRVAARGQSALSGAPGALEHAAAPRHAVRAELARAHPR